MPCSITDYKLFKPAHRRRLRERLLLGGVRCSTCRFKSWLVTRRGVLCSICARALEPKDYPES